MLTFDDVFKMIDNCICKTTQYTCTVHTIQIKPNRSHSHSLFDTHKTNDAHKQIWPLSHFAGNINNDPATFRRNIK